MPEDLYARTWPETLCRFDGGVDRAGATLQGCSRCVIASRSQTSVGAAQTWIWSSRGRLDSQHQLAQCALAVVALTLGLLGVAAASVLVLPNAEDPISDGERLLWGLSALVLLLGSNAAMNSITASGTDPETLASLTSIAEAVCRLEEAAKRQAWKANSLTIVMTFVGALVGRALDHYNVW
jgi:hypothetical protein